MALLTLSILRCPAGVPPETRRLSGGDFTIGRGTDSGWVLPDPDKFLSKQHCVLSFRNNNWQLTDTSSNGTFLNHEVERLDAERPRVVRNGDRLLLGSYEIEVTLDAAGEEPLRPVQATSAAAHGPLASMGAFEAAPAMHGLEGLIGSGDLGPEPLVPDGDEAGGMPAGSDHASFLAGNFQPPRATPNVLPADWDADDEPFPPPLAKPEPPAAAKLERPVEPPPPLPQPAKPAASEHVPEPDGLGQAGALLLQAAGARSQTHGDPAALLRDVGQAFRAVVVGLRRIMIGRAAVKGEFRIEQTMIRPRGNNPLKFSADDEDALAALLGAGRHSEMSAEESITDALRDMRLHELAMASAMQQAVREMLGRLDPAVVARATQRRGSDGLPTLRKARLWDGYAALHARTVAAFNDDFESLFGKAFARAYERAMAELNAQQE